MRWHVELNETGTSLRVEHVDDENIARRTARELAAEARGGHSRASADRIVVAELQEADTDDDCWKCRSVA